MSGLKSFILRYISYNRAERLRGLAYDAVRLSGAGWFLSQFRAPGLAIFAYHSIGGEGLFHDNVISREAFDRQLSFISKKYTIIPLLEIVESLRHGKKLPRNCVALTFDDGYRDFLTNALPVLRAYNAPSTFFIPTDILYGKALFFDVLYTAVSRCSINYLAIEHEAKPLTLPLNTEQNRNDATLRLALITRTMPPGDRDKFINKILEQTGVPDLTTSQRYIFRQELLNLGADVEIGSHSCGHYNLAWLSEEQLETELVKSKHNLEQASGKRIELFAYPFGKPWSFNQRVQTAVRYAGYRGAVTTIPGLVVNNSDAYAISRYGATNNLSRYYLNCRGIHL